MKKAVSLLACMALVSACASKNQEEPKNVEKDQQIQEIVAEADNTEADFNDWASKNNVYFAFDNSDVKDTDLINSYVEKINKLDAKNSSIYLYGYCDNNGSREYNQKLGIRRADAVKKALQKSGVQKEIKIITNSFGKDKYGKYFDDLKKNNQANRKVEVYSK